jgi:hypothetical protein
MHSHCLTWNRNVPRIQNYFFQIKNILEEKMKAFHPPKDGS